MYMHVIQVNEKGQLRLSRKALLPEATPEKSSAEHHATDKASPRRIVQAPKDGLGEEYKDKDSAVNSPRSDSIKDAPVSKKKVYKGITSSGTEGPKNSVASVSSIASKDEGTLVNGDAKIG
jgi:polyribonucleotide nucleotidyltransferase